MTINSTQLADEEKAIIGNVNEKQGLAIGYLLGAMEHLNVALGVS